MAKEVLLMEHNYKALKSNESMFLVAGAPSNKLANRAANVLGKLTVGDVAVINGLSRQKAGLYPERAYPNANSRRMKQALAESYDAISAGKAVVTPDFDPQGNIRFDHICRACANNDSNRVCKLFEKVFRVVDDDHSTRRA